MTIFPLFFLFCIACSRYETPPLPSFSDDRVSYEEVIEKQELLKKNLEKSKRD